MSNTRGRIYELQSGGVASGNEAFEQYDQHFACRHSCCNWEELYLVPERRLVLRTPLLMTYDAPAGMYCKLHCTCPSKSWKLDVSCYERPLLVARQPKKDFLCLGMCNVICNTSARTLLPKAQIFRYSCRKCQRAPTNKEIQLVMAVSGTVSQQSRPAQIVQVCNHRSTSWTFPAWVAHCQGSCVTVRQSSDCIILLALSFACLS